jgi:hypothetical protein
VTSGFVLAALLAIPHHARADDGVYGRFDGDVMLSIAAGGGAWVAGPAVEPTLVAELRLRYLDAVGPFVGGQLITGTAPTGRIHAGLELRPLFPALFLLNLWTGVEVLDLTLQSLGVELGVAVAPLGGTGDRVGVAFAVGLGLEIPVVPPSVLAHGIFVRLAARHVRAGPNDHAGPGGGVADWTLVALLSVPAALELGIASREVARFRPDPP